MKVRDEELAKEPEHKQPEGRSPPGGCSVLEAKQGEEEEGVVSWVYLAGKPSVT